MRADRYHVVVIGTKFGVAVNGDRRVDVDVDEGVVEVWNNDVRLARLEPGQRWNSSPESDEATATRARAPAAKLGDAADKSTEKFELPRDAAREGTAVAGAGDDAAAARRRRTIAVRRRTAGGRSPCSAPRRASPPPRRRPRRAPRWPPAMRRARWRSTRTLAQKPGPVGENAAYEIGRILNEKGQSAAAVAAWRRYRSDYPNGILRVEADVSIIETLARAGESDDALTEATDFLRRRPDSERRGEIARVAGDLYRARGDCRHAVGAYQVALASSRARDVLEAANFYRAACLVRVGDGGGVDALRGYLRSFPDGRFKRQATELVEQTAAAKTTSH